MGQYTHYKDPRRRGGGGDLIQRNNGENFPNLGEKNRHPNLGSPRSTKYDESKEIHTQTL